MPHLSPRDSSTLPIPKEKKKKKKKSDSKHVRLRITSSYSFQEVEKPGVDVKGWGSSMEDMVDGYARPKVRGVVWRWCVFRCSMEVCVAYNYTHIPPLRPQRF